MMRILNKDDFMKEPNRTVYIRYTPRMFVGEMMIKMDNTTTKHWHAISVIPWVQDEEEEYDKLDNESNYDMKTVNYMETDDIINHKENEYFAVFNKEEIKAIIDILSEVIS